MRIVRALAALGLVCSMLAGCVSTPHRPSAPTTPSSWSERRSQLQQLPDFALTGRVAIAAGNEGFNARLQWQQREAQSEVALQGPLGVGGVHIRTDGGALSVTTTRGESLDSAAAHAELNSRLGFDPPLASLRYWLLGVPDPATQAMETLNPQGRLAGLGQDGWQIDYPAYTEAQGDQLPQRITLHHGDVRIRLIVDHWQ